MIYIFINTDFGVSNATSDKSLREVPNAFKELSSFHVRRVEWETIGIYHTLYIPYDKRDNAEEYLKSIGIEAKVVDQHGFNEVCKKLNSELTPTNEAVIREAVTEYLNKKYSIAHIQGEYTHPSLPVRADLFAITKDRKVITVEIKSDRDTFTRLKKQLEEYATFSHGVYVALDIAHLVKFKKNFPSFYGGILVYEDGELKLHTACTFSKNIDAYRLLWKQEHLQFLPFKGITTNFSLSKLNEITESVYTVKECREIAEFLFINRYVKDENDFSHLIVDYDYKQELVDRIRKVKKPSKKTKST